MAEAMNLENLHKDIKELYLKTSVEEGGKTYLPLEGQSLKKSPSVWSPHDYYCEVCGKTFTQCHVFHRHKRYHCRRLKTEIIPKQECARCGKIVSKTAIHSHAKNGCPRSRAQRPKQECETCGKMVIKNGLLLSNCMHAV